MVGERTARPAYVRVEDRDVHWHEVGTGTGRTLVMLHASPGSGKALLPLALRLLGWQVLVLDTPGCGRSDPLPQAEPSIEDYARATVATLTAMGVNRCAIFGTHTGAKIALSAVHMAPELFSGLVLDGLGVSTADEREDQLARYTPHHEPVADGSHLIRVWHQVRDMALFWPWYTHDANHRLGITLPSPENLHETAVDMLRNLDHYGLTYHAAFRHDPLPNLTELPVPTLLLAAADDPLQSHLARVTGVSDRLTIDTAAHSDTAPRLMQWLQAHATESDEQSTFRTIPLPDDEHGVWRTYLPSNEGNDWVHITVHNPRQKYRRPLVALHACPGSGRGLMALAAKAGHDRLVVCPDLPGLGASSLPDNVEPNIEDLAGLFGASLADFLTEPADLYGTHTGAAFALEWADTGTVPAHSVLLDGMMLEDTSPSREDLLEHYAQALPAHAYGLHALDAWHRVRNMMLFWPWYCSQADAARLGVGIPPPQVIHNLVTDLLGSNLSYHYLYKAAFRYHAEPRLERLRIPAVLSAQPGDPLAASLPLNRAFSPSMEVRPDALSSGLDGVAQLLGELAN